MKIVKTYKFKLYGGPRGAKKNKNLHQQIDIAGLIYNHCIALHRRYYRAPRAPAENHKFMDTVHKSKVK